MQVDRACQRPLLSVGAFSRGDRLAESLSPKNDCVGFDMGAAEGSGNGLPSPPNQHLGPLLEPRAAGRIERRALRWPVDAAAIVENAPRLAGENCPCKAARSCSDPPGRFPQSLGKRFAFPTSAHRPNLFYVSLTSTTRTRSYAIHQWRLWKTPPFASGQSGILVPPCSHRGGVSHSLNTVGSFGVCPNLKTSAYSAHTLNLALQLRPEQKGE